MDGHEVKYNAEETAGVKGKTISSGKNPLFRQFVAQFKGRGIRRYGRSFISGPKQVFEVVRDFPERCAAILLPEKETLPEGLVVPQDCDIFSLGKELFRKIDLYGTHFPVLQVRLSPLPAWNGKIAPKGCTLFLPFQDPGNVGSAIRAAAAFGVTRLVVLKEAAHPFHHKAIRAAGSTIFRVPIYEGPSIHDLKRGCVPMVTLSARGQDVGPYRFPKYFGLLPGLEGPGLPAGWEDNDCLAVPMSGGVESLNAVQATVITLYLWRRQAVRSL
jgi:tRNA G18 (ribose-2'-O)-methylase SpoU